MSHVVKIEAASREASIANLDALAAAVARTSPALEFMRDQTTFESYAGSKVPCRHAIRIRPDARKTRYDNYEIGLVESTKHPGAYDLAYDPFGGGIDAKAGPNLENLTMFYTMEQFRHQARQLGQQYAEKALADGTYEVTCTVPDALPATIQASY